MAGQESSRGVGETLGYFDLTQCCSPRGSARVLGTVDRRGSTWARTPRLQPFTAAPSAVTPQGTSRSRLMSAATSLALANDADPSHRDGRERDFEEQGGEAEAWEFLPPLAHEIGACGLAESGVADEVRHLVVAEDFEGGLFRVRHEHGVEAGQEEMLESLADFGLDSSSTISSVRGIWFLWGPYHPLPRQS